MSYKRGFFVAFALFFGLSLVAALLTFVRANVQRGEQRAIGPVEKEKRRQAASWTVYETAFHFPYKTRGSNNMTMLFPFTRNFGFHDKQNSQGFWTPEYTTAHPPNTFRIVIIGNGMTSASNVPLQETYPYVLAGLMNRQCNRFNTEVISLALNGHKMTDHVVKLFAHAQYLKPDLVIFQTNPTDVEFYNYGIIFRVLKGEEGYNAYAAKQVEVFREDSLDWKVFLESVAAIKNWSDKKSVPVGFLVFPPVDSSKTGRNFNHYDATTMSSGLIFQIHPKFVAQIQSYGFPALDLVQTFREKAGDRYLASSEIFGGLNPYAHRLIAENLESFLIQEKIFGCSESRLQSGDDTWEEEKLLRAEAADEWLKFNMSHVEQLKFYEKLHRIHPKDPWITSQLADVNLLLFKRKEAYDLYSSLVDMAPAVAAPWYQMAFTSRNPKRKVDLMQKMLQVNPDHLASMEVLAIYSTVDKACPLLARLNEIPSSKEQLKANTELFEKNQCDRVLSDTTN